MCFSKYTLKDVLAYVSMYILYKPDHVPYRVLVRGGRAGVQQEPDEFWVSSSRRQVETRRIVRLGGRLSLLL